MGSSDCPNKKNHCQNTNKHVGIEMVLAESSMLAGCSYLAKWWLGMKYIAKLGCLVIHTLSHNCLINVCDKNAAKLQYKEKHWNITYHGLLVLSC